MAILWNYQSVKMPKFWESPLFSEDTNGGKNAKGMILSWSLCCCVFRRRTYSQKGFLECMSPWLPSMIMYPRNIQIDILSFLFMTLKPSQNLKTKFLANHGNFGESPPYDSSMESLVWHLNGRCCVAEHRGQRFSLRSQQLLGISATTGDGDWEWVIREYLVSIWIIYG